MNFVHNVSCINTVTMAGSLNISIRYCILYLFLGWMTYISVSNCWLYSYQELIEQLSVYCINNKGGLLTFL